MKILIIGKGWLGGRCHEEWPDSVIADKKIQTEADVLALLDEYRPDVVLNAAGVVGKPNVDWCETHQVETIEGNTVLPITIACACQKRGVYLLHMGTGCIFYGASPHGGPWDENDFANPTAVYTRSKYAADLVLSTLSNVAVARIRLPIDDRLFPGNLIDKLSKFSRVVDVENSVTVVPDMIKIFRALLEKKAEGIFHCTNPGSITHKQIIALYEKYIDSQHQCEWIKEEDLVKLGIAAKKRSNNVMTSVNLPKLGIAMRPVEEAVEEAMKNYATRCHSE
ncbi:MAG: sugar nucleotide-binding protein [Candidatus Magasanikbacteria bacterium]